MMKVTNESKGAVSVGATDADGHSSGIFYQYFRKPGIPLKCALEDNGLKFWFDPSFPGGVINKASNVALEKALVSARKREIPETTENAYKGYFLLTNGTDCQTNFDSYNHTHNDYLP